MTPRVKTILEKYKSGNLKEVYEYLTQENMTVDKNTWANQIKSLIENEQFLTAKQIIELMLYKFYRNE